MNFAPTASQRAVQELFRSFAEREIRPQAEALDRAMRFPVELFRKAGDLGFFGMRYPEPDGSGADVVSFVLAVEELAWGSLAVAAACTMQSLMGTHLVHHGADADTRARLLPAAIRGEAIGTICMTEPDAGSDLAGITTRAVESGGRWLVSGAKTWITSASVADFFTVLARTGENELSFFLVEKGASGLSVGREIEKSGVRASPTSEVSFQDTPATCPLSARGEGMGALKAILAEIRVMTAALAVGIGRAALEDARRYATERKQFGRPIREFQAVQQRLADAACELEAARRLTHWAAWRSDQGLPNGPSAAMAKLFASEAAFRVCDAAARVLASYGFATESPIERYLRDVRFVLIGGGTSEILRTAIAREL